jgi:hypothetical protein
MHVEPGHGFWRCKKRQAEGYFAAFFIAAGIEPGCPQGWRRLVARGEEATLGATAARCHPVRQPRTTGESPLAALLIPILFWPQLRFKANNLTPTISESMDY